MMNKKILISLSVIGVVAAIAIGGTIAYFSDTETSTGNTFTAGAIDLTIDNESYYNYELMDGNPQGEPDLSWEWKDLEDGDLFFDFSDLKPGDWGEDTISLHVSSNDAWACADVTLTSDDDNTCSEPELEDDECSEPDDPVDSWDGELADNIEFIWWADDGDNVLENDEQIIHGPVALGYAPQDQPVTVTLADSDESIFPGAENGLISSETYYIGKAWCFGNMTLVPVPPDDPDDPDDPENSPTDNPGILCDGDPVNNAPQTDRTTLSVSFRAEQARNNGSFDCQAVRQ